MAKICVFGYCVCDEQFHILQKEDILINPNGKFHLTDRGGDGLVLPYDYDDFKKYPDFKAFYEKIKGLLEDKDSYVFGHAAINDVKYLCLETKRYKLPSFQFRFADTQVLYMAMTETYDRQAGLESLTQILKSIIRRTVRRTMPMRRCVSRRKCAARSIVRWMSC